MTSFKTTSGVADSFLGASITSSQVSSGSDFPLDCHWNRSKEGQTREAHKHFDMEETKVDY